MIRRSVIVGVIGCLLLCAIVVSILVPIALSSRDPWGVVATFVLGPFRSLRYVGNIVEFASPTMLCGLAVAVMFRAGMFNLGAEGAFFLGGLGAVGSSLVLPHGSFAIIPMSLLVGSVVGSSVCIVPAYLKVRFEASELVSSLMLNFVALYLGLFLVNYFLRDPTAGAMVSYKIPPVSRLPILVSGTRVHLGVALAFVACMAGYIWIFHTHSGFETRLVGSNPSFADHIGLNRMAIMLKAQAIGGLLAAFAGGIEMLGLYQRFSWQDLPGNGWTGLVAAILGRNNPGLIVPAALFLAYLQVGGDLVARTYDVPSEVVGLINAAVLLLATSTVIFGNPRLLAAITFKSSDSKALVAGERSL